MFRRPTSAPTEVRPGWRIFSPEEPAVNDHNGMTQFRVREGFTEIIHDMLAQPDREEQPQISGMHLLVGLLLVLTLAARLANINFNTLYLDEAIYATVGEDVRAGVFKQGATTWMFGSYLYPFIASVASELGGVMGLRILSAFLMTGAAALVYLASRRLFGPETGLWTLFLFGLSGMSISLGQQAVLDALGVPLLALALYWIVSAVRSEKRQKFYLTLAGFAFSLSVLAKYIALMTLPALVLLIVGLHLYDGRSIWRVPWHSFFVPMIIVLGIYGAYYSDDLMAVLSGQFATQIESRPRIFLNILQDIGVPIALTMFGMAILAIRTVQRFYAERKGLLVIVLPLLGLVLLALLILPLYHLASGNERSMWKHNVYTLLLISPLAGYGIARTIQFVRSFSGRLAVPVRVVSAVATVAAIIWMIGSALRQNDYIQRSWPNNLDEIAFIEAQNLVPDSRILSPSYAIYEYYFDTGVDDRFMWNNIWYTEYETATGTEAIRQSIADCSYDLIVLDNYYAPEWAGTLEPLVQQSGYAIAYSTMEVISTGDTIITNIYQMPEGAACQGNTQPA